MYADCIARVFDSPWGNEAKVVPFADFVAAELLTGFAMRTHAIVAEKTWRADLANVTSAL